MNGFFVSYNYWSLNYLMFWWNPKAFWKQYKRMDEVNSWNSSYLMWLITYINLLMFESWWGILARTWSSKACYLGWMSVACCHVVFCLLSYIYLTKLVNYDCHWILQATLLRTQYIVAQEPEVWLMLKFSLGSLLLGLILLMIVALRGEH